MNLPERYVITIGRTFGSGGRAVGRLVADALGIGFYDKKLLVKAAEKSGLNHQFVCENDERMPRMLGGIIPFSIGSYPSGWFGAAPSSGPDSIYKAQSDLIHELAAERPCVIVGRSADYVLRDHPRTINLFVHAPMEARIDRIIKRQPELSREKARAKAEKINRLRANYYNFYTDKTWGAAESYDLTLDTSLLSMSDITEIVREYMTRRFRD